MIILIMWILGIDTSSHKGSIAITSNNKIISEKTILGQQSYSKKLFLLIDSIIQETKLDISQIDAFAVSIGPGSFTGLRVGLSAALGLSLIKKPVIPIETLPAMAHTVPFTEQIICPVIDARKGELYTSFFQYNDKKQLSRIGKDRAISPEVLIKETVKPTLFFGSGVDSYGELISLKLGSLAVFSSHFVSATAASLCKLGFEKIKDGTKADAVRLKPKYIRRSEAEIGAKLS